MEQSEFSASGSMGGEACGDLCQFGPGDGITGAEGSVAVAGDDAHIGQGGNGVVAPHIRRDVGIGICLAPILGTNRIPEQTEENGYHLAPADVAVGAEQAVLVADDIGVMLLPVQSRRVAAVVVILFTGTLMIVEGSGDGVIFENGSLRVPGGYRIAGGRKFRHTVGSAGRQTLNVHMAAGFDGNRGSTVGKGDAAVASVDRTHQNPELEDAVLICAAAADGLGNAQGSGGGHHFGAGVGVPEHHAAVGVVALIGSVLHHVADAGIKFTVLRPHGD